MSHLNCELSLLLFFVDAVGMLTLKFEIHFEINASSRVEAIQHGREFIPHQNSPSAAEFPKWRRHPMLPGLGSRLRRRRGKHGGHGRALLRLVSQWVMYAGTPWTRPTLMQSWIDKGYYFNRLSSKLLTG